MRNIINCAALLIFTSFLLSFIFYSGTHILVHNDHHFATFHRYILVCKNSRLRIQARIMEDSIHYKRVGKQVRRNIETVSDLRKLQWNSYLLVKINNSLTVPHYCFRKTCTLLNVLARHSSGNMHSSEVKFITQPSLQKHALTHTFIHFSGLFAYSQTGGQADPHSLYSLRGSEHFGGSLKTDVIKK